MKLQFNKNHLSYEEQTKLLQSRNLTISNFDFAIKKLSHLNYYRFSAYFYPFFVLSMIQFILISINDEEFNFKKELKKLLKKYQNIDIRAMGFLENWEELEIWRDL